MRWWRAPNPTFKEWNQHNAYVQSMITLNIINLIGAGVDMRGSAANAWNSLMVRHNMRSNLELIHAKEELNVIKYMDRSNIEAHFQAMHTAWAKANNQGAGINNKQFQAYIIKSMPSS